MCNRTFVSLLAVGTLVAHFGARSAGAQADSVTFPLGTIVRVKESVLGPGWHEGKLVGIRIYLGGKEQEPQLGFAPSTPSKVAAIPIDAIDTVEVWVPRGREGATMTSGASASESGLWVLAPRARLRLREKDRQPMPR